jgi:prevent-host-death family protein
MKTVALRDAKQELSRYVKEAQTEHILITTHGRPAAVVIGVSGYTIEEVLTASDPQFWSMVADRRAEHTVSIDAVERRLKKRETKEKRHAKKKRPSKPRKKRNKAAKSRR